MIKGAAQHVISMGVIGLLLFGPAGTARWPQAWIFLGLLYGCSAIHGLWLRRLDPALLAERMRSPVGVDQTPRDRAIMVAIMVGFAAWLALMGLDARRFTWSHMPPWAEVVGAALIVAPFFGWPGVMRANSFAATRIRLQPERGHRVVDSGPYAVVRHPMYAYSLLLMFGIPLLLGSLWGLVASIPLLALLVLRIRGEEAILREGLPGYRDYMDKVRFRLVPGVW